jgi:CelD/BcsL family acetyltransferase involved in cellulose biosynthesis
VAALPRRIAEDLAHLPENAAGAERVIVAALDLFQRARPAPAAPPNFPIEIHGGESLAGAEWPSITAPANLQMYAFQSREFLDLWMRTIGKARGSECFLVVVRDDRQRPVLYLPLAIETRLNVRLLRFMDAGVSDYNAPILASEHKLTQQQFERLWSEIVSLLPKFDAFDLQKTPSDVLGRFNPLTYLDGGTYISSGHSMALGMLPGGVNVRPSVKAQRKNLRRRMRALAEIGHADFVVNPTAASKEYVLDRLLELKKQKYLRTIGRDFLAEPGVARFYREIAAPNRLGRVSHLSAVICNGKVVAGHLGFIGRGRFHYVLPAYDVEFRRFEVGHLLLQHLIDQSHDKGLRTFDLGVGDFPYKARWSTHRLALYSYERPLTLAGWLFLQTRRARDVAGGTGLRRWLSAGR